MKEQFMILYKFIYLLFFIEYFKYLTFIYSLKSKFNALSIIAIYEKYSMFFLTTIVYLKQQHNIEYCTICDKFNDKYILLV